MRRKVVKTRSVRRTLDVLVDQLHDRRDSVYAMMRRLDRNRDGMGI